MDRYAEVFERRGDRYDRAMRRYPQARDNEFMRLLDGLDVSRFGRVYDIPAGGGYLRRFVAPDADLVELEPASHFGSSRAHWVDLERLDLEPASADLIVSLAALHHVANKSEFFAVCLDALQPGGCFCVGDAVAGSRIARFLDGFVGAHNGMGHAGSYLDPDAGRYRQDDRGKATLTRFELAPCPWLFSSANDMAEFCRDLFGLDRVDDAVIIAALEQQVGVRHGDRGVALEWELLFLRFEVPALRGRRGKITR